MTQWKSFKSQTPEEGRLIIYGNHRWVGAVVYKTGIEKTKKNYKDITHWFYIDLPPVLNWDDKWKKNEEEKS